MSERMLGLLAGVLAALVLGLAIFWQPDVQKTSSLVQTLPPGGDFALRSADGPVRLGDLHGKLVLVYFGYTYCPDICPTSLAATGEGLKQLTPDERKDVAMIFVSVDPRRDTVERLKEYVAFFDPAIVGVTGSADEVADVARRYGVFYAEQKVDTAGGGYVVDHSAETFIVGRDGRLVARMAHGTPPAQVAALIRQYLHQP
ncbi:MAG: SCO family protein [Azonexaceae bacterium]|nr:SCO family protein [Azonexaceae bacterium]